jgi:hypothetical protein
MLESALIFLIGVQALTLLVAVAFCRAGDDS